MDRISGLMPQVGWSPLLAVATPKRAPATTVEPAAKSANTNGGMSADVNAQAQAAKVVQLQTRAQDAAVEAAVLAQSRAAEQPDPDAPTGPPPTFDVTPLEAKAAALRAAPKTDAEATPARPARPEPSAQQSSAPEATAEPQPEPATQSATQSPVQGEWQATAEAPEPSLDVTR